MDALAVDMEVGSIRISANGWEGRIIEGMKVHLGYTCVHQFSLAWKYRIVDWSLQQCPESSIVYATYIVPICGPHPDWSGAATYAEQLAA